jgi:hypothetical protein
LPGNLFRFVIQDGSAVVYLTQPGGVTGSEEHGFGQAGFTCTPMGNDPHCSEICYRFAHENSSLVLLSNYFVTVVFLGQLGSRWDWFLKTEGQLLVSGMFDFSFF